MRYGLVAAGVLLVWATAWAADAAAPALPGGLTPWMVAGLLGNGLLTNVIMVWLKRKFPEWDRKAWAPPLIGAATALFGALAAGQIIGWNDLAIWLLAGLGSGATASSWRDAARGK